VGKLLFMAGKNPGGESRLRNPDEPR